MSRGPGALKPDRGLRPSPEVRRPVAGHAAVPTPITVESVVRRAVGNQGLRHLEQVPSRGPVVPVAPRRGPGERNAEAAEAGRRAPPSLGATAPTPTRSPLAEDEGRPVPGDLHAWVHQGPADRDFVRLLGARAATHGRDIFLGEGESEADQALMRHELTHVQEGGDLLRLRSATRLERRAWLSFFDYYLPRKFLNNYMDDSGTPIRLTLREMQDCNPIVDLRRSPAFVRQVAALTAAGGGKANLSVSGWGGALTNGTLGNFTIEYTGTVVVRPDGTWTFSGTMTFRDYWDFDPKGSGSGRPWRAEAKVRVASALLPGRPFKITSMAAAITQSSGDNRAIWGGGVAPTPVPDRAGRTGADIVGGDVTGGEIGAEVGAQASEDLN